MSEDSEYRIVALKAAIDRAGQDGGIEGGLDLGAPWVYLQVTYYHWLTGEEGLTDPALELKDKK